MVRLFPLVLLCLATGAALAQRNEVWNNPGLSQRGIQYGEQQLILRQDMSHCHGSAFDKAREITDEHKRKALGVQLFNHCMAEKGWFPREAKKPSKPEPKGARETAT